MRQKCSCGERATISSPTKMNLMRRGVVKDARCPICEREAETITHILWRLGVVLLHKMSGDVSQNMP
jgi:hypothetical protein